MYHIRQGLIIIYIHIIICCHKAIFTHSSSWASTSTCDNPAPKQFVQVSTCSSGYRVSCRLPGFPPPLQTLTQHHKLLLRCVVLGRIDLSTHPHVALITGDKCNFTRSYSRPSDFKPQRPVAGPFWAYLRAYEGQSVHREVASLLEAEHSCINRHQQTSDGQRC